MARYSLFVLKVPLNANQPLSVRYCFWLHRFVRKMSVSQMWRWSGGRGIWTELSLCYSVVWHYNGAQWYQQFLGRSTGSGVDLVWFSSLFSEHLSIFGLHGATLHSLLLLNGAWWDWPLTNHCPSVLWHCWFGHVTCKIVVCLTA